MFVGRVNFCPLACTRVKVPQLITGLKVKVCVGNSSVVKIYIIRPKPGLVA